MQKMGFGTTKKGKTLGFFSDRVTEEQKPKGNYKQCGELINQ